MHIRSYIQTTNSTSVWWIENNFPHSITLTGVWVKDIYENSKWNEMINTYRIIHVLSWRTVNALTRGLFWCLFPELRNTQITLEWVHKQFVTRVLVLFYFLHDIRINQWDWKLRSSCIAIVFRSLCLCSVDDVTIDCWWRLNYPTSVTWPRDKWHLAR